MGAPAIYHVPNNRRRFQNFLIVYNISQAENKHNQICFSGDPHLEIFPRSGCSAVINNATNTSNPGVNGLDRRILNYDKYLKVIEDFG